MEGGLGGRRRETKHDRETQRERDREAEDRERESGGRFLNGPEGYVSRRRRRRRRRGTRGCSHSDC